MENQKQYVKYSLKPKDKDKDPQNIKIWIIDKHNAVIKFIVVSRTKFIGEKQNNISGNFNINHNFPKKNFALFTREEHEKIINTLAYNNDDEVYNLIINMIKNRIDEKE